MTNKKITLVLLFALSFSSFAFPQINDNQLNKIDSLFIDWNKPNQAGGCIGIMHNGKIIFSKGYGLASLEYLVPNTPGTLFNIASVSKQFTAMGIVLLKNQGKLSYDDDIRKYIPDLPCFKDTITIRHLLHHTSGMRSFHSLLELAGWRSDDSRSNEDIRRFMKKQTDLNFNPGEKHMYCNNGYMFMADVIEKITSEKFVSWTEKNIFTPLGMDNSYIEDEYNRIVPNNATSYHGSLDNGFKRAVEYWGYVGSGNMHSNTRDLLNWIDNFNNPQKGWEIAFKELQTPGILNNGDTITYSFGIIVDSYKGEKRISHGGSIGGYRSVVCCYPEQKLSIVILTNFSSSSVPSKLNNISDILLNKVESLPETKIKTIKLSAKKMKKFCDFYWNENQNNSRKIYLKNDTLRYRRSENSESNLLPVNQNEFLMENASADIRVIFKLYEEDKKCIFFVSKNDTIILESFKPPEISVEMLNTYSGRYYSEELMTFYELSVADTNLVGYHPRHGNLKIKVLRENNLEGEVLGKIKIKRDNDGYITGIYVSNGRAKNVWFEKLNIHHPELPAFLRKQSEKF